MTDAMDNMEKSAIFGGAGLKNALKLGWQSMPGSRALTSLAQMPGEAGRAAKDWYKALPQHTLNPRRAMHRVPPADYDKWLRDNPNRMGNTALTLGVGAGIPASLYYGRKHGGPVLDDMKEWWNKEDPPEEEEEGEEEEPWSFWDMLPHDVQENPATYGASLPLPLIYLLMRGRRGAMSGRSFMRPQFPRGTHRVFGGATAGLTGLGYLIDQHQKELDAAKKDRKKKESQIQLNQLKYGGPFEGQPLDVGGY